MRPAVLLALVALAACGDDAPSATEQRADQARDAAVEAGLAEDVAELLADAAAGLDATYSVTYELADSTVVVTQRPPDRRIDVTAADGTVDTTLTVDGRTTLCTDPPGDEPVACEEAGRTPPTGVFDEDALAAFGEALAAGVDDFEIVVDEREVAGAAARCLVATADGDDSALCLSAEGAVLLVERAQGTLRATSYSTDVAADAFTLPAGTG